jgi:hypothetical protein
MDILGLGLPITRTQYFDGLMGPTDIGGDDTILWFDWTDTPTVVESSGNIESISNKVTVTPWSTHVFQAAGGTPVYSNLNGQNGFNYSNHLGGGQSYELYDSGGSLAQVNYGENYTIAVVQENDALSGVSGLTGGRSPNGYSFRWSGSTLIGSSYAAGGQASDSINPVGTSENDFGFCLQVVDNDNDQLSVIFNGDSNTPGAISGDPVSTVGKLLVGKANNTGQYFTGKIYEFMLFKGVLTAEQLTQLDTYVKTKYDFTF